jgi:pimeloyl-ACP methyl ester carboxylesterase
MWRRLAGARLAAMLVLASAACATPADPSRPAPPAATPGTLSLSGCRVARVDARCGTLMVFEDRAARTGRRIPLRIVVLPATTDRPAPDPVFFLAGGPGQAAASSLTAGSLAFFEPIRRRRDVVLVDQRGTGGSHRLECRLAGPGPEAAAAFGELFPIERVRACRRALEPIADLALYTTPIAMDDLDEVRAALGHATINLDGVSYGTLAALQYVRQHADRVRAVALSGVATPALKFPVHFATGAQTALDALLADCAADADCRRAFPDLAAELAALVAGLNDGPVRFELAPAGDGARVTITMSRGVFAERLRLLLYDPGDAARVPLVVHRAAEGDWVPFARATWPTLGNGRGPNSMGMYLSVTCSEFLSIVGEPEIERTRGTLVGEYRTRQHAAACAEWPRGAVPPEYYAPVAAAVPVLMLSGTRDAATPPSFAAAAARTLPRSRQLLITGGTHAYGHACLRGLVAEFLDRASADGLDTGCVSALPHPPFVLE